MLIFDSRKTIILWCVANIFFAFQFIMRLCVGILREDIMYNFNVDAAAFSTLSGYYYLGYGISQIPFGLMLDRFSYRIISSFAILFTAIGMYLFATTTSWGILLFSRFLIGFGSGISFLAIAKITKACFEEKYHSILIGLSFTFGLIGAVFSTTPLIIMFKFYGNQQILLSISAIAAFLSFITFVFGKINFPKNAIQKNIPFYLSMFEVISNFRLMLIGISGGLMVGALEGFADVWGIPFFNQIFNFSLVESSQIIMYVYFGMCFGGPILVIFANFIRSESATIVIIAILTSLIFIILFKIEAPSMLTLIAMMFILGIFCCYQVLVFNLASREAQQSSTGLAISSINCINMCFGYVFHSLIGKLFSYYWSGQTNDLGIALYNKTTFIASLSLIPILCILGGIGFSFIIRGSR